MLFRSPLVPSLQGVYRKGKWALSGSLAITGGGGKATFNDGLPMFEAPIAMLVPSVSAFGKQAFPGATLESKGYSINQYMHGINYIFGAQLGATYEINDMFSVYGGFRLNIVHNEYEGSLTGLKMDMEINGLTADGLPDRSGFNNPSDVFNIMTNALKNQLDNTPSTEVEKRESIQKSIHGLELANSAAGPNGARLESKQSGWGVAPVLGVQFSQAGLNIGAKDEFKTSLNV